jgi:hypothetical protein
MRSTVPIRPVRRQEITQGTLPCETDQAKPDRISRLARSTKLSKILEGSPPERDPWIETHRTCVQRVLELDALYRTSLWKEFDPVEAYCHYFVSHSPRTSAPFVAIFTANGVFARTF